MKLAFLPFRVILLVVVLIVFLGCFFVSLRDWRANVSQFFMLRRDYCHFALDAKSIVASRTCNDGSHKAGTFFLVSRRPGRGWLKIAAKQESIVYPHPRESV